MRLIDADELILSLNNYIDKPITVGLCATLIHLFPTAYDIDKVVEELEEEREEILNSNDYENEIINYCLDSFDRAIEIVEQGVR